MAQVTPPNGSQMDVGFTVLGVVVALPLCVVLSLLGFVLFYGGFVQQAGCFHGVVPGLALVVLAALLVGFAWYMFVRNRSNGRGASFVRGFAMTLAVFLLAPWPCSFTWSATTAVLGCAH